MTRLPLFRPDPIYAVRQGNPRKNSKRLWTPPGTTDPPPPSPFLTDLFTDTNGVNLTAHTPDVGGTWSVQPGNGGGAAINNNKAYATGATVMINSAAPLGINYEVIGQLTVLSALHNTTWGVLGHASNSAITMFGACLYCFSGSFSFMLNQWLTSSFATLSNPALPVQPTLGSTHELKLRIVGNQISAFYDTVQIVAPTTNNNIPAAGFAGLILGTSTTTTGVHMDSITTVPL